MITSLTNIHLAAGQPTVKGFASDGHRWVAIGSTGEASVTIFYSDRDDLGDLCDAIMAAAERNRHAA